MDLGNANFVDKRIEQAAAEESRSQAAFVTKADEVLSALAKDFPSQAAPYGYRSTPIEINELTNQISRAANLAWALRRFAVFDTSCLKMMRKEKALKVYTRPQFGPDAEKTYELDIWVPVFGFSSLPGHGDVARVQWQPTNYDYMGHPLDEAVKAENRRELDSKMTRGATLTLETKCPPVPGGITRKVDQLSHRFERTSIVWEAQWSAYQEIKDPLILGHIGNLVFLLDQFDASKLERYVMGEFCTRPKE